MDIYFLFFSESISTDERKLSTVVNENIEAPIEQFTIKNEPAEVEHNDVKQEPPVIFKNPNPLCPRENASMGSNTNVEEEKNVKTKNMEGNGCEAALNAHKCKHCHKSFTTQRYLQIPYQGTHRRKNHINAKYVKNSLHK